MNPKQEPAASPNAVLLIRKASLGLTLLLCAFAHIGWIWDRPLLRSGLPDRPAMTLVTAWLFGALALVLLPSGSIQRTTGGQRARWLLLSGAILTGGFSCWILLQYVLGLSPTLEMWMQGLVTEVAEGPYPGRPSPHTASLVLLLSLSLGFATERRHRAQLISQGWALLAFLFAWFMLVGLFSQARGLYGLDGAPNTGISPFTALAALSISVAALTLTRHVGLIALMRSPTVAGSGLRWLVPLALSMPLVISVPLQVALRLAFVQPNTALALNRGGEALVLLISSVWFALNLERRDKEREASQLEQARLHVELAESATREALLKLEARFHHLYEFSPVGLVLFTPDGRIQRANSSFCQLFGYPAGHLQDMRLDDLVGDSYRAVCSELKVTFPLPPSHPSPLTSRRLSLPGTHRDGALISLDVNLTPVPLDMSQALLAAMQDVTEREVATETLHRSAQQLKRSNQELERFAYAASHDLVSPLRGIDELASWLAEDLADTLPEPSRIHLEKLRERAQRMQAMLKGLLTHARYERSEQDIEETYVEEVVRNAFQLLTPPVGFQLVIPQPLPILRTVRAPLAQCFRNLLDNAIKHHDQVTGTITITSQDQGAFVKFTVSDDGPGIPTAYQQRVDQLFGMQPLPGGSQSLGFGLPMIRKTIETAGGELTFDQRTGRGSTFHFTWPRSALI